MPHKGRKKFKDQPKFAMSAKNSQQVQEDAAPTDNRNDVQQSPPLPVNQTQTLEDVPDRTNEKLAVVEKVVKMLQKNDTKEFVQTLEKFMIGSLTVDADKRKEYYQLVSLFFKEVNDCKSKEELVRFKESLEGSFRIHELKKLTIAEENIELFMELPPTPFLSPMPKLLGSGAFSMVHKGRLKKPSNEYVTVAVKSARAERFEPLTIKEARILSNLKHPNIIKVMGIAWSTDVETHRVLLEYMCFGNLVDAQLNCAFSRNNLMHIIRDVASALEYISEKKYIHRDVACRNVMINGKKQTKLADFALAQYVGDSDGVYEQKTFCISSYNVSPESFVTQKFRIESDVWSFGLLVWEMFYFLERDFEFVRYMTILLNHKGIIGVMAHEANRDLPRPPRCPLDIFKFVKNECMRKDYKNRPSFSTIRAKIDQFITTYCKRNKIC